MHFAFFLTEHQVVQKHLVGFQGEMLCLHHPSLSHQKDQIQEGNV